MRKRTTIFACVVLPVLVACGANTSANYEPTVPPSCDPRAEKRGVETTVTTSGFVREVAVVDDTPWVAIRGGLLEKLDPACRTSLATIDLGTSVPRGPTGTTLDFVAMKSAGAAIWTIVEWLNQAGSPEAYYVLRVDTKVMKVTATQPLADLEYSRTSDGLAVNGDSVWVADAAAEGAAAKLDPTTAAVVGTVQSPAGPQSASQNIAVDEEGRVWLPDGQHSIVLLDLSGAQQGRIDLGPADPSNPNFVVDGRTAWLAGEQLQMVSTDSGAVVGVSRTKVGEMSPDDDGLWAVSYPPQQAVLHITAGQLRTTATYPVSNETVSMDSHGNDVWRVDFEGLLHHIAG